MTYEDGEKLFDAVVRTRANAAKMLRLDEDPCPQTMRFLADLVLVCDAAETLWRDQAPAFSMHMLSDEDKAWILYRERMRQNPSSTEVAKPKKESA